MGTDSRDFSIDGSINVPKPFLVGSFTKINGVSGFFAVLPLGWRLEMP
jgi:hypothetical protein